MLTEKLKIAITSDLHWGISDKQEVINIAGEIIASAPDVIVILGDIGTGEDNFINALSSFSSFKGLKLFVPGNHDLWLAGESGAKDSLELYEKFIPIWGEKAGFSILDHKPVSIASCSRRIGLAGSIGWYDYTLAPQELGFTIEQYATKKLPGVRWQDGTYVSLGMTDIEFTDMLLKKLRGQIESLSKDCEQIIVFTHHLIQTPNNKGRLASGPLMAAQAFLGSSKFLELLTEFSKVTHHACGHLHLSETRFFGSIKSYIVGSNYYKKDWLSLEI